MTPDNRIIESVPNFSEGRNKEVIDAIAQAIASVEGVKLLHVDMGYAAHRTVITFAGPPQAGVEGAFQGAKTAGQLIDMRLHHGTHPRIGATDVLPLVPIKGITLEECAKLAQDLARRMAHEEGIPCYCYEAAALRPAFRNLAVCRAGEYEALPQKLAQPELQPDIMPDDLSRVPQVGCSVVGARPYLIAVNFNLNTKDVRLAKAIAAQVRQKGNDGRPDALKTVKAIGWYIDEYGIAQVSTNLTDISVTPLHTAFEAVSRQAQAHGLQVTGTEIIGLVPKQVLIEAGHHFMGATEAGANISDDEAIRTAVQAMHLDDLRPFRPQEKVIEYVLERQSHL